MSDNIETSKASIKLINSDSYIKSLSSKPNQTNLTNIIPKTKITSIPRKKESEQEILSNHFCEHYLDIGGWTPKHFLEVSDISNAAVISNNYVPMILQKFEIGIVEQENESDSAIKVFETQTEEMIRNEEKVNISQSVESNPKVQKLLERLDFPVEDDALRFAKLQARNRRVHAMVDSMLKKSQKKNPNAPRLIGYK